MNLFWTSLKISIAGAKLSHLVQKDRIWDHGSMAEQVRLIFYMVQKARASGNTEFLKKNCTISCFEILATEMKDKSNEKLSTYMVIKKLAVIEVNQRRNNKPDMFKAFISGIVKNDPTSTISAKGFVTRWSFVRYGDWWLLDKIRS